MEGNGELRPKHRAMKWKNRGSWRCILIISGPYRLSSHLSSTSLNLSIYSTASYPSQRQISQYHGKPSTITVASAHTHGNDNNTTNNLPLPPNLLLPTLLHPTTKHLHTTLPAPKMVLPNPILVPPPPSLPPLSSRRNRLAPLPQRSPPQTPVSLRGARCAGLDGEV